MKSNDLDRAFWARQVELKNAYLEGYQQATYHMRLAHGNVTLGTSRTEEAQAVQDADDAWRTQRVRDAESGVQPLTPPGNRWLSREPYSTGHAICLHDGEEEASACPHAEGRGSVHITVARVY